MSQILLCIESNELKNLIKASFAPYESIQLIFTEDADDIQNFINIFTDVKAIVSEAFIKEKPVTKQIDSILSNRPEPCDLFIFDKEAEEHQQVLINLKLLFGIESEKAEKKSSALTSMPSHLFLHFTLLPFALFKCSGADEFSEVIPANTSFTSESLYQLIHEGHTELYFDKQHIRNFSKSLIEQLEGRITAPEKHSCHDQIKIEAEVFHSSRDIINSLGLKPKVVSICDKAISNLKTRLKIEKDLKTYLDKLNVKSTYHYHFSHVSISSFVAFQVINQKEIPSYKKDELALKLLFSAYFSDLAISEETVSHYPRITPDVLKIIHETNEAKNGLSKETQLHPLSSILIVAQNFADQILLNGAISNKEILDNLESKFKGTPCQSAYFDLLAIFS